MSAIPLWCLLQAPSPVEADRWMDGQVGGQMDRHEGRWVPRWCRCHRLKESHQSRGPGPSHSLLKCRQVEKLHPLKRRSFAPKIPSPGSRLPSGSADSTGIRCHFRAHWSVSPSPPVFPAKRKIPGLASPCGLPRPGAPSHPHFPALVPGGPSPSACSTGHPHRGCH